MLLNKNPVVKLT